MRLRSNSSNFNSSSVKATLARAGIVVYLTFCGSGPVFSFLTVRSYPVVGSAGFPYSGLDA